MATRILFKKKRSNLNECEYQSLLDQEGNLPPFSFHLCVCSYRFLQER